MGSVAKVRERLQVPAALSALGVRRDRPVMVLVGGAGGMAARDVEDIAALFRIVVFPVLDRHGAAVLDGGTDSGVMRAVGRARAAAGAGFPLVGVAAEGTVDGSKGTDSSEDGTALEPNHTHLILVPGKRWGDESQWLTHVATAIAGSRPSVTLVVNGGRITIEDVERSLAAGRPVVVLAGTGRTADAVAGAAAGHGGAPLIDGLPARP
jgi:hypothetical protein